MQDDMQEAKQGFGNLMSEGERVHGDLQFSHALVALVIVDGRRAQEPNELV
jgi:hypothetical protein